MEWGIEVYELDVGSSSYLLNGFLDLYVPVARAALETGMSVEDGCHQADENACVGIGCAERINEGAVVGDEILLPVGPVSWVGVVEAKMDHHPVGAEVQRLTEFWHLHVGPMSFAQQR